VLGGKARGTKLVLKNMFWKEITNKTTNQTAYGRK
jgi:hypothetical protein